MMGHPLMIRSMRAFPLFLIHLLIAISKIRLLGNNALLAKVDIKSAFRLPPNHPNCFNSLGLSLMEHFILIGDFQWDAHFNFFFFFLRHSLISLNRLFLLSQVPLFWSTTWMTFYLWALQTSHNAFNFFFQLSLY